MPQWAGIDGLANLEAVDMINGKIETNIISNKDGTSFCEFTIDSSFEIEIGNKISSMIVNYLYYASQETFCVF